MTKKEEDLWRQIGLSYSDSFLGDRRVRQVLKKINLGLSLTRKQDFLNKYGDGISELKLIYDKLKRFPLWLSSFQYALEKRNISRVSQFIYHIENYLALIYIFDQRIRGLYNFIEKMAKKNNCSSLDIQNLKTIKDTLLKSIEPIVTIRGKHTHEKCFENEDIKNMIRFDKAGDFSQDTREKIYFKTQANKLLSEQRKKWKKDILSDIYQYEVHSGIMCANLNKLVWQIYTKIKA